MELIDIRIKDFDLAQPGDPGMRGLDVYLYEKVLDRLGLNPSKLKKGSKFTGQIRLEIKEGAANFACVEITHMGIEPEKKESGFMSSK